ncbi:MAG: molybdate ABC transporter permease subunit [Burkholderiaceae bacterium]
MSAEEWAVVWLSLQVAVVATIAALPFGVAVAWWLARGRFVGRWLLDGLVHLPLVLPPVVTGYLLLVVFGRQGLVGHWLESLFGVTLAFRWTGAALASAVMGFPLMVRAIRLSFEQTDRRLEQAAGTLGASPWRVFRTVSLPLAAPGILAGAILAFAKSLGEFGATITFVASIPGQTQTLPSAIYALLQVPGGETAAMRLSAVAIVLSLLALALSEALLSRRRRAQASGRMR